MAGRGTKQFEAEHSLGIALTMEQAEPFMACLLNAANRASAIAGDWRLEVVGDRSTYAAGMVKYYEHLEAAYRRLAYNVIEHVRHTAERTAWHYQI